MNLLLRPVFALALATLLLLCAACASQSSRNYATGLDKTDQRSSLQPASPAAAPFGNPGLPAPDTLPQGKSRGTRFVEADLLKDGAVFDAGLPNARVSAEGSAGSFAPGTASGLAGCAYCVYRFSISGYDSNAQIRAHWAATPDDSATYIALANWDTNRWDWFAGSAEPKLTLASLDPYFSPADELLVAVLCSGQAQSLSSLRIGGLPPQAGFSLSSPAALIGSEITLDAGSSSDSDGSIARYEWDLDGDGTFETDNAAEALLLHSFSQAGYLQLGLRVTDDEGLTAAASAAFTSCAEWTHSLGKENYDGIAGVAYDGQGGIFAGGYVRQGDNIDLLMTRFNLAGELVWARSWDGSNTDTAQEMAISSEGKLVLCGSAELDTGQGLRQNLLIQVWSPEGELLVSRFFDNGLQLFPRGMAVNGEHAYVLVSVGGLANFGLLDFDISSGSSAVIKCWTYDSSRPIFIRDAAITSLQDLTAVGSISLIGGGRAIALQFSDESAAQLDLVSAQQFSILRSQAGAVVKKSSPSPETIVCGYFSDDSNQVSYFTRSLQAGGGPNAQWSSGSNSGDITGLTLTPSGDLCAVGSRETTEAAWLMFPQSATTPMAHLLTNQGKDIYFSSGLVSIAGVCGLAGGECAAANDLEVADISLSGGPQDMSWSNIAFSEAELGTFTDMDLPGAVTEPELVLDSGSGETDAMLVCRPF